MELDKYRNEVGFAVCPKCKQDGWYILCDWFRGGRIGAAMCQGCGYVFKIYNCDVMEMADENSIQM